MVTIIRCCCLTLPAGGPDNVCESQKQLKPQQFQLSYRSFFQKIAREIFVYFSLVTVMHGKEKQPLGEKKKKP